MKIEQKRIDEITPYANNPRDNRSAVGLVADSIEHFGFLQPIVVTADGTVIVGHTRLEAAKALGLETVPVIVADDLTEQEADAYRIVDNKVGELSYWDVDLLNEELQSIGKEEAEAAGFRLEETGLFDLVQAGDYVREDRQRDTFAVTLNFTETEYAILTGEKDSPDKDAIVQEIIAICKEAEGNA